MIRQVAPAKPQATNLDCRHSARPPHPKTLIAVLVDECGKQFPSRLSQPRHDTTPRLDVELPRSGVAIRRDDADSRPLCSSLWRPGKRANIGGEP